MTSRVVLNELFTLTRLSDGVYRGPGERSQLPQVYGGTLVAQSLVAAMDDVADERVAASCHTVFIRPGRLGADVDFRVERTRDGRSMSTRQVDAWQDDRLLSRTIATLTTRESGIEHARPQPQTRGLQAASPLAEVDDEVGLGLEWDALAAIDIRIDPKPEESMAPLTHAAQPRNVWMRCVDAFADDPRLHQAAIAYASDVLLASTLLTPHGYDLGQEGRVYRDWQAVSLDHTMWFHGHADANDWMLWEHSTPVARGGLGLASAAVFDSRGNVAAHATQQARIRPNNIGI